MVEHPSPGKQYGLIRPRYSPQYAVATVVNGHRNQVLLRRKPVKPCKVNFVKAGPPQALGAGLAIKGESLMSHTPFIMAAYLIGAVVLFWAAMAPVLKKRTLLRQLKARQLRVDKSQ